MKYLKLVALCLVTTAVVALIAQEAFIVPKKSVVSIGGLKQECAQQAIFVVSDCAALLSSISDGQKYCMQVAADIIQGSAHDTWKKPTKTQLEAFNAQAEKVRKQAQELSRSIAQLQTIVS